MTRMFAPAAVLILAAGAGSAQVLVPKAVSAPPVAPPAALASGLLAPSFSPTSPTLPGPAVVLGVPGPGVTPAHLEAVKALAIETNRPWVIHGSRQTGVSHHTGEAFKPGTDLDTALIGKAEELLKVENDAWDGKVPHMAHGPMMAIPTVEEAVGKGHLVVAPPLPAANPWRTASQLSRLQETPRAKGEPFKFAVIGDAEPGRFWVSRKLFNVPGVFWKLLGRAEASKPDFIFQMGDMVSRGTPGRFKAFLQGLFDSGIKTPFLTAIGNHDRHKPHGVTNDRVYRATFGETNYVFDRGGRRFVVLDSSAGRVTREQLIWLKSQLSPSVPTVVFTHVPPAPLGEWTDWGRLKGAGGFKQGAEEFMRLMAENKVERVYMGHIHALGALTRDGVTYVLTGGGGSPLFPGPVKTKVHHWLSVEAGPAGLVETVHTADGRSFPLH